VIAVQIFMGLLNTSDVMTSTCLGELTDGSNDNSVFRLIPVTRAIADGIAYVIAAAAFPVPNVNTTLFNSVENAVKEDHSYLRKTINAETRFLSPCMTISFILAIECIVIIMFLPETFNGNQREYSIALTDSEPEGMSLISPPATNAVANPIENKRNVVLVIVSYMIFELSETSYTQFLILRIITPKPIGAGIDPVKFGLAGLIVGLVSIFLQFFSFTFFINRFGIQGCYCYALLLVSVTSCVTAFIPFEGVFLTFILILQIFRSFANMLLTSCSLILVRTPADCFLTHRLKKLCLQENWEWRTGCW
jgi:hypothetical protein